MFTVDRTFADLRFTEPSIDPSERPSPACYHGDPEKSNNGIGLIARATTLETWLSIWSLADSQSRSELQAAAFSLPTMVIQSRADMVVLPSMAQGIYDKVGSKNEEIRFIPGAHFFEDSQESLDNLADVIAEWTKKTLSL